MLIWDPRITCTWQQTQKGINFRQQVVVSDKLTELQSCKVDCSSGLFSDYETRWSWPEIWLNWRKQITNTKKNKCKRTVGVYGLPQKCLLLASRAFPQTPASFLFSNNLSLGSARCRNERRIRLWSVILTVHYMKDIFWTLKMSTQAQHVRIEHCLLYILIRSRTRARFSSRWTFEGYLCCSKTSNNTMTLW